jgi:hypothetical protein
MIELTSNSEFDNVNVPFKLFWEQCDGGDWALSTEKGYRQLLIIDVIGNVAAEITIPHKITRELTLEILIGITKLPNNPDIMAGGETTLSFKVHKHKVGGLSLWEQELMTISFDNVNKSNKLI